MHNHAIETRTSLRLRAETEAQAQGKENSQKIPRTFSIINIDF